MLLGAGAMGELTARHLLAQGVGSLMVANRTFERAIDVARALGGMPVPWDGLSRTLPLADLIIGAASGDDFLLGPSALMVGARDAYNLACCILHDAECRSHGLTNFWQLLGCAAFYGCGSAGWGEEWSYDQWMVGTRQTSVCMNSVCA